MKLMTTPKLLLAAALTTLVESSCTKRQFYAYHSKTYPGPIMYEYTKATQTAEQCQRMCNQILKCTGFVMRWAYPQRGFCDFFQRDSAFVLASSEVRTTVYMNDTNPCRSSYSWGPYNHCYHYHVTSMTWDDAYAYCTSTDPDAYLVEITSKEKHDYLIGLVGGSIWLGGRLFSGTWTWPNSGQIVSGGYQNWSPGQPDWSGDCMAMISFSGLWFNLSCGYTRYVVCEYGN